MTLFYILLGVFLSGTAVFLLLDMLKLLRGNQNLHHTVVSTNSEYLPILRAIDKLILSHAPTEQIASEVVNLLPTSTPLIGASLRMIGEEGQTMKVVAVTDVLKQSGTGTSLAALDQTVIEPSQIPANNLVAQSINARRIIYGDKLADFESPVIDAATADAAQAHFKIATIVAFPLIVGSRVLGVLTFYDPRPTGELRSGDVELMQSITDVTGIAVENGRLISEMEAVNGKLSDANTYLKKIDESKDEFISIAAHQLRSPLTAIKGYVSMVMDADYGKVSQEQEPVLRQVEQSTNDVINIINDMLSISRINAGKFELSPIPTKLEEVIKDVAYELQPLADKKELKLILDLPKSPIGTVMLDANHIRQVLINYIDNAIKYTPRGNVTVKLRQEGDQLRLTVTDTGIGIPRDEISHMFDKFYRASNARQLMAIGSGLGLFVAKRIIEDHGGQATIASEVGKGTSFGFIIPITLQLGGQAVTAKRAAGHNESKMTAETATVKAKS